MQVSKWHRIVIFFGKYEKDIEREMQFCLQNHVQVCLCPQHVCVNMSVHVWMKYRYTSKRTSRCISKCFLSRFQTLTLSLLVLPLRPLCLLLWCLWFLWLLTQPYYCLSNALGICFTFIFLSFGIKSLWHTTNLKDENTYEEKYLLCSLNMNYFILKVSKKHYILYLR